MVFLGSTVGGAMLGYCIGSYLDFFGVTFYNTVLLTLLKYYHLLNLTGLKKRQIGKIRRRNWIITAKRYQYGTLYQQMVRKLGNRYKKIN